mmetsp:Transcript_10053/g.39263  ORF Transcript_10053/g.39263 Transcript_10053/m.39263 type:complete len:206 (+) Transcript_10053:1508-2125(+)
MPSTATTAESGSREPPSYECRLGALESDVIDVSDASESLRSLPRARLTGDMGISDALGVGRLVDLMSVGDVGGASVAPSNVSLVLTCGGGGRANPSIAVGERERKVASWHSSSSSSSMDPGSMLLDLLSGCRPTPPGAEFAERSSTSASIFAHVSSTTCVSPRTSIANFRVRLLLLILIRTSAPVSSIIFRRNSPPSVAMKLAMV